MKAVVCTKPGLLEYKNITAPVSEPGHSIIRIKRIGICGTDLHAYTGTQPYFQYPRILGHELSGDFVGGDGTAGFVPGERLTFIPYFSCNHCIACRNGKPNCCEAIRVCGVHMDGGMTEYLSVPNDSLIKSEGLSYEELALVEPLSIGAHAVRRAGLQKRERVLVIGAGPIGISTMEFARIAGAEVIGMDISESRLSFCKEKIGIHKIINSADENAVERLKEMTSNNMPTAVFDATGNLAAINEGFQFIAHGGKFILVGLQKGNIVFSHPEFHKREATLMSSRNATKEDFSYVIDCIKEHRINPLAFITHVAGFEKLVEEFQEWLKPENAVIKAMVTLN
jgi:2-desacetyl-2-hydroxyethyl bacteriochlorophyllide A dehydrogenase